MKIPEAVSAVTRVTLIKKLEVVLATASSPATLLILINLLTISTRHLLEDLSEIIADHLVVRHLTIPHLAIINLLQIRIDLKIQTSTIDHHAPVDNPLKAVGNTPALIALAAGRAIEHDDMKRTEGLTADPKVAEQSPKAKVDGHLITIAVIETIIVAVIKKSDIPNSIHDQTIVAILEVLIVSKTILSPDITRTPLEDLQGIPEIQHKSSTWH